MLKKDPLGLANIYLKIRLSAQAASNYLPRGFTEIHHIEGVLIREVVVATTYVKRRYQQYIYLYI